MYEEIFNSKTKFDDILVSYFLYLFAEEVLKESTIEVQGEQFTDEVFSFSIMPVIALSRIVMQKYFTIKRGLANGKELNLNLLIKNIYQHNNQKDTDELYRILIYTIHLIVDKLHHEDSEKLTTKYKKLMNNLVVYETIKEEVEDSELNIEAIQKLEISWLEPPQ